jgi:hypothetical protein
LLPSEKKELPRKYQALKSDLDLMLRWAVNQSSKKMTLDDIGEWMCDQSRVGKLQVLLFWPSLHSKLPVLCDRVRGRRGGPIGPAEAAKNFMCQEYGLSRAALSLLL